MSCRRPYLCEQCTLNACDMLHERCGVRALVHTFYRMGQQDAQGRADAASRFAESLEVERRTTGNIMASVKRTRGACEAWGSAEALYRKLRSEGVRVGVAQLEAKEEFERANGRSVSMRHVKRLLKG